MNWKSESVRKDALARSRRYDEACPSGQAGNLWIAIEIASLRSQ